MSEKLISEKWLREEMNEYILPLTKNNLMGAADAYYRTIHLFDDAPAVDAVAVVWCGNCKHYFRPEYTDRGYCDFDEGLCGTVKNDSFCCYGERREENAVD